MKHYDRSARKPVASPNPYEPFRSTLSAIDTLHVPACVRMILSFHDRHHTEADLAQAFGTVPLLGTLPENVVSGLDDLGYNALWFENATLERLRALLAHGWPPIVLIHASDLPYGRAGLHAVVVVALSTEQVIFLDPTQSQPTHMPISEFVRAWNRLDHQGMAVWP